MSEKLVPAIVGLFGGITSAAYGKEIIIFIISLMPILELRGGLIAASLLGVDLVRSIIICVIGNLLPIPFILLLITKILEWMRKSKIGFINKVAAWLDEKVEKHKGQIEKFGYFGIILFVGIPIPGTGAWTGSLIASVLEMDRKKTFLAIIVGVAIACLIMSLFSYGLLARLVG